MRARARKPKECKRTAPSPAVEIVEPLGHRHVVRGLSVGSVGFVGIRNGGRLEIERVDRQLGCPVLRFELLVRDRFIALREDGRNA